MTKTTNRGKTTIYDDEDIKKVRHLVRLGLPVETFLDLELVYNHDFFKHKKQSDIQYYYYMLLRRRDFFESDIDKTVLSLTRLQQYVTRLLVVEMIENNEKIKTIIDTYHVSQSFISLVKRDLYQRTNRRVPSVSEAFESILITNIKIAKTYINNDFDYVLIKYNQFNKSDLKLITSVYASVIKKIKNK